MEREQSNRRRGVVLWYTIVLMLALCLLMSLAVDYGRAQVVKTELMRAADSAARAAAAEVPDDFSTSRSVAIQFAALNTADGAAVKITSSDIVFGNWDLKTKQFTPLTGSAVAQANAVQVTARRTVGTGDAVPLLLAGIFGPKSCNVSSTVVAHTMASATGIGIVGLDWVSLNGNPKVDSYRSVDGPYSPLSRRYNGNVASNGDISLNGSAQILGNASPGVDSSVLGGYVSGSKTPLKQPLVYPAPTAGTAKYANNNFTVAKYLSSDNSFSITGHTVVDFHAGVYYFNDFRATGGTVINANIDGPVTIYVAGDFTLTGGSSAYQGKPQNLKIVLLNSSTSVTLTGNSDIYADLYAPLSDVKFTGTSDFYGQMVGKSLALSGNGQIHCDESMTGNKRKIVTVK